MNCSVKRKNNRIRLLAEWEPQDAVLLTWPHIDTDWHSVMDAAEKTYVNMAVEILEREPLIIVVRDNNHARHVETLLPDCRYTPVFVVAKSNDTWIRDYGPLSVEINEIPSLIDFRFNAWGTKYPFELDDQVTGAID